jgi:hypothetical protein
VFWVCLYGVAMAAVEAAVVVYLRALHAGPAPVTVFLAVIPDPLIAIEVGREAATIVMLVAVATLAGRDRWERFLYFALAFGVWDIGYYAWLRLFIGWPPSLLTWDVLFLIPVPWLAPVLAPLVVSAALIMGSLAVLGRHARGVTSHLPRAVWMLAGGGAALVLLSFMLDYRFALERLEPTAFRWGLFGGGVGLAMVPLLAEVRRRRHEESVGSSTGGC